MWNQGRPGWALLSMLLLVGWLVAGCTAVTPSPTLAPADDTPVSAPAADATNASTDATATPIASDGVETAALNLSAQLARQLQIDPASVEIVSVEPVEWPDACLGAAAPDEMCAQVITPGYKITLSVDGATYVYHTDTGPSWMRLVSGPEVETGAPVITWTGAVDNGSCQEAVISAAGIAFGNCGGVKMGGKFVSPARLATLEEFANRYASFEAETEAGKITFNGAGAATASAQEQLRLARWTQTVAMEAASGVPFGGLAYYGPAEFGSPDTSKCASLMVGSSPEAVLGACDGTATSVPLGDGNHADLQQLVDRFAPFVYETPTESLQFDGLGAADATVWQPAILAWARTKHAELATGRVSAAGSTVLSWDLGQTTPDEEVDCNRLTVLAWGYAYAEVRPCAGGDVKDMRTGWLETPELEALNVWLYDKAPLNLANAYVTGTGSEAMTEDDISDVEVWAGNVYHRIWTGEPTPAATETGSGATGTAAGCIAPGEGEQQWIDDTYGYCLNYPAEYVVEQTLTNTINIVLGSIMNHIDPRVSIEVTDAGGRTLDDVSNEIVANYGGFDETIGMDEVAGDDALIIDGLPGQDLNRRVAVIHDGRLYSFFFTPLGEPDDEAARAKMDEFYYGIIGSFRFR